MKSNLKLVVASMLLTGAAMASTIQKPTVKKPLQHLRVKNQTVPYKKSMLSSAVEERIVAWADMYTVNPQGDQVLDSTWVVYNSPNEGWLINEDRIRSIDTAYQISSESISGSLSRYILTYDAAGYNTGTRFDTLAGNVWNLIQTDNTVFDANHNEVVYYTTPASNKSSSTYTSTNKVKTQAYYNFANNNYVLSDTVVYTYDAADSISVVKNWSFDTLGVLTYVMVDSTVYNTSHRPQTIYLTSNSLGVNPFSFIEKTDFTYVGNNRATATRFMYDSAAFDWQINSIDSFFYVGNQLVKNISLYYNGVDMAYDSKTTYQYQGNNLMGSMQYYYFDSTATWYEAYKTENTYTNFNNLKVQNNFTKDSLQWNQDGYSHYYFENYNTTSVDEKQLSATSKIYPNPTTGKFTIQNILNENIVVTDVVGNVVFNTQAHQNNIDIDLSNYTSGLYFVKAGANVVRVVKQ